MIALIMAGMLALAPSLASAQENQAPTDQDFFKIGSDYASQHPVAPQCYRQSMALIAGTDTKVATDAALTPAESVTANIAIGKVLYIATISGQTIKSVDDANTQLTLNALAGKITQDDFNKTWAETPDTM